MSGRPLTVSAGVCDLSQDPDAAEVFRLADAALSWAKSAGRDCALRYTREAHALLRPDP